MMPDREHDEDDVYIAIGWGERWTIPLMVIGIVSIPLLSLPFIEQAYDFVRVFVLVQATIMLTIQGGSIVGNVARGIRAKANGQPQMLRILRWAYTARIAASTILTGVMTYGVTLRLGDGDPDWRTPVLQLCLLLLAISWGFMDRRIMWLERRADTPEFLKLMEQFGALQTDREQYFRRPKRDER